MDADLIVFDRDLITNSDSTSNDVRMNPVFNFTLDDIPEPKSVQRKRLSYIRDHYLHIFYILLFIIGLLIIAVVVLAYFNLTRPATDNAYSRENYSFPIQENRTYDLARIKSLNDSLPPINLTSGARDAVIFPQPVMFDESIHSTSSKDEISYDDHTIKRHLEPSSNADQQQQLQRDGVEGRTYCQKMRNKCKNETCFPTKVDYDAVHLYSCCCLPDNLKLISYERFANSGIQAVILRDFVNDVSRMSRTDISLLPRLRGLPGTWQIILLSDSDYVLKYTLEAVIDDE